MERNRRGYGKHRTLIAQCRLVNEHRVVDEHGVAPAAAGGEAAPDARTRDHATGSISVLAEMALATAAPPTGGQCFVEAREERVNEDAVTLADTPGAGCDRGDDPNNFAAGHEAVDGPDEGALDGRHRAPDGPEIGLADAAQRWCHNHPAGRVRN